MIDTKLLRQKILDLAIRGKLVPQNPDDEPASVLLEKIRQEKAALVKVGKIKKDKHESFIFRGEDKHYYEQIDGKTIDITDEIPFDIPETWEWCRLAPLLHYLSTGPFGSALHKRDYVQGGIPLINPMHIDMEKAIITPSDNARISPETVERLSAYKLSIGDIVIARRGEMGRAAIITEKEQGWLCGTGSFFLHFSSLFFNDYFINFIHTYSSCYFILPLDLFIMRFFCFFLDLFLNNNSCFILFIFSFTDTLLMPSFEYIEEISD